MKGKKVGANRILFIAPSFFGYYKEIIKEFKKKSFEVDYICDFPSNSTLLKALARINRKLIRGKVEKYYKENVLELINRNNYEYVFIIVGMTFSFFPKMIEEIKNKTNSKIIMYQWDGEKNIKFIKDFHKYADTVYSFDRNDCEMNDNYTFLPLFYTDNYKKIGNEKKKKFEYDVSYIGTAHPKKIKLINEMSEILKKIFKRQFIFHYMPSKFKFYYHKVFSKEYRKIKLADLNLEKLSFKETMNVFKKSRCILDAPQEGQTGLTIRTIECLGAKRKLITTNKDILNYDFYNPKNIYIYDGIIDENNVFFRCEYEDIPNEIYRKYSLECWIEEIIKYKR